MQTFQIHIGVSTETAIQLKFAQQLDIEVRQNLMEQLVELFFKSDELQIQKMELHPTLSDPFQTGVRYYIRAQIR